MLTHRLAGLSQFFYLGQVVAITVSYGALFFAFDSGGAFEHGQRERYLWYLLVALISFSASKRLASEQRVGVRIFSIPFSRLEIHGAVVREVIWVAAGLLVFLVASKDQGTISRAFLVAFVGLLYLALFLVHWLLPAVLARFVSLRRFDRTLVLGSGVGLRRLNGWLQVKKLLGLHPMGYLNANVEKPELEPGDLPGLPCLGSLDDLESVLQGGAVDQVILVRTAVETSKLRALIADIERRGIRVMIYNNLEETLGRRLVHFQDDTLHFSVMRPEPLENAFNRAIKRVLDVAIAMPICVLVLPPLALIVHLFQRWQSPGPLLYGQLRTGLGRSEFKLWKFRTMHVGHGREVEQAGACDERIFPFGAFLRRISLDEFPQFVNVLRGEMSVVGPRPHYVEHTALYSQALESFHVRSLVKPGITGLAQIRGFRGEIRVSDDLEKRVAADIEYLENWRLALDIDIIIQTIGQMIQPPSSAY